MNRYAFLNIMTDIITVEPWYMSQWFSLTTFLFAAISVALLIISIIRRRKIAKEEVRRKQEQKAYEEKVQMLINLSYELRTPLTLIMAPIKRLLNKSDTKDENYQTLTKIYRQSLRMKDMLNMVIDLRKMEIGANPLDLEERGTSEWLMEVVRDFIEEERIEGIEITVAVDPGAERIIIDSRKCEAVLVNMIINAVKYSLKGDTIAIKAERSGESIRISVADQGPGIGDLSNSDLFARFYQSDGAKFNIGIGLSYAKILVELHGGKIGAYNNPDRGATFWWEIPTTPVVIKENDESQRAYLNELMGYNPELDIKAPESKIFDTNDMTLMLIDDNQDLVEFLQDILIHDFKEIITAESGNKALKLISSGTLPDIIVSDVSMPDGDGYFLCDSIKNNEKYSHIPIILMTASGDEHSQSEGYRLGADGVLVKPFEMETLIELIRGLLKRRSDIKRRYLDEKGDDNGFGSKEEGFIIKLNKIVSEHISDPNLDQELLCRELGMSRALLYNRMKSITGTGTKEYITKIRIEKAKSLMKNPSLSISDIAEMTGFTSQSYFSTAFKSYTGTSPSQFRRKKKE